MSTKFNLTIPKTNKSIEFESLDELVEYIQDECNLENSDFIHDFVDETNEPYTIGNLTYYPSVILSRVDPVAWGMIVSDIVESEIDNLKYEVENFELEDGDTFNCCGLEIEVVLENND
jgi:hypothetical protein